MRRELLIPTGALILVALFLVVTAATRLHEGRCRMGVGRRGLDCTYPAGTFRPWP